MKELQVTYSAPGAGKLHFGWNHPFKVDDKLVALHDYPHWNNSYAHVDFASQHFRMKLRNESVDLGFQSGQRTVG